MNTPKSLIITFAFLTGILATACAGLIHQAMLVTPFGVSAFWCMGAFLGQTVLKVPAERRQTLPWTNLAAASTLSGTSFGLVYGVGRECVVGHEPAAVCFIFATAMLVLACGAIVFATRIDPGANPASAAS